MLGGTALVVFAAIFFRLWFVEVLSGEAYLREANTNRVREVKIPAPRGNILDANGHLLVGNESSISLQVQRDKLFRNPADRERELKKLSEVADMSVWKIKKEIREQTKVLPASPVTLDQKVPFDLVAYLRERQDQFPGVTAGQVSVRKYPEGTLGAHLFGYVAEIGPEQLKEPAYDGLDPGDQIGASGLEAQYDNILRGRNGAVRVQVDAMGEPRGRQLSRLEPEPGENLVLTLDEKVQKAGEAAIGSYGLPGAFVAMDVRDGSVLGMGSFPNYDPNVYVPPVSADKIDALTNAESEPLLNRAIQGDYPTGSTFKLITATAALEEGVRSATEIYNDVGFIDLGNGDKRTNAGDEAYGAVDMIDALRVSSDTYFYTLGIAMENVYEDTGQEILQDWAKRYGFGSLTGIDLPAEGAGLVPTPEWRNDLYQQAADPDSCGGEKRLFQPDCYETDRPWSIGDNVSLSVGQGDLGATPLQLAVAYAALGNGGQIVHPHLGDRAENAEGQATQEIEPAPAREIDISPETHDTIMEGLRQAANEPGGTSYDVFGNFPIEVAGKTGTAEKTDQEDQAWYAVLAPADDPQYVVVTTIERGGFGATTAAPAACAILAQIFKDQGARPTDCGSTSSGYE